MTDPKRPLLDALFAGRHRARALKDLPLVYQTEPTIPADAFERELEEARKLIEGSLLQRERARMQLTALVRELTGQEKRAAALRVLRELEEVEEAFFGPLRLKLSRGEYSPAALRAELASRPSHEHDPFVDRLLGIYRAPVEEKNPDAEQSPFLSSSIEDLWPIFERLGPDDVFYDLGSGVGKVAFLVRFFTGAKAKGVEYDAALGQVAEKARQALNLDVELIVSDARTPHYEDGTFFYFFEPFRGPVLDAVFDRIKAAAERRVIHVGIRWLTEAELRVPPWLSERPPLGRVRLFTSGRSSSP